MRCPDLIRNIYVDDTFCYVADDRNGLRIINISDPENPTEVGFYDTEYYAYGVYTVDTLAYIADTWDGLRIINVSDPTNPVEIGFYDTDDALSVHVVDSLAYVANLWNGLRIINVSDPTSPSEIGFYNTNDDANDVYVVDSLAYVAGDSDGLRIINVSDPTDPVEIGFYDTDRSALSVYVVDSLAYVADGWDGLRIINVSDPTNPVEIGFYDGCYASSVYVVNGVACISEDTYGLFVIDVSDPTDPNELGYYETGGTAYGVQMVADLIYLANYSEGLYIIKYTGDIPNPFLMVTDPNGGESWQMSSTYDITWASNKTSGNVQIEYSTDNGSNWTDVIASMPDTGSYPWVIPNNPSHNCLVRISDTDGDPSDISDAVFTIYLIVGVEDDQILREGVSVLANRSGLDIKFSLAERKKAKVEIFNLLGQRVEKLMDGVSPAGIYNLNWNGNNGIYFVRVEIGDKVYRKKAIVLR